MTVPLKRRLSSRELRLSRPPPTRDMDASPFSSILADLVTRLPGAFAAALVDHEGETVDYAGSTQPFEVKIAAAHWRIVMNQVVTEANFTDLRWIVVRGEKQSFILHALPDGYALIVILRKRAGFVPFARPISVCIRSLGTEAEWTMPEQKEPRGHVWFDVRVDVDRRHRPERVFGDTGGHALEVLGAVVGLRRRERGWRVRLESGKELTLVRELGGFWYADEEPR
jgi:predicted regulator of Ras-like GTPase activity (Roadblock/LC7/MglB family)